MMLEMVEPAVSYVQIIQAAVIPAVLYYVALLLTVHFHAKRIGALAEPVESETTDTPLHFYQGVLFFGSFVILIAMLLLIATTATANEYFEYLLLVNYCYRCCCHYYYDHTCQVTTTN